MTNTKTVHTAIWFYSGGMTRGFLTGRTTPEEHALLVANARAVQERMPEVEAQIDTVDGAVRRWIEAQLKLGVDEDALHAFFGHQLDVRDADCGELLGYIETVGRADLGLAVPQPKTE